MSAGSSVSGKISVAPKLTFIIKIKIFMCVPTQLELTHGELIFLSDPYLLIEKCKYKM